MFNFEAAKEWDNRRNMQVILMRRNQARTAIHSLRYYRSRNWKFVGDKSYVESRVREAIQLYRQTMKVLSKN